MGILFVVLFFICIFMVIGICCLNCRREIQLQTVNSELARRRRTLILSNNNELPPSLRVTTIAQTGHRISMGVYEIPLHEAYGIQDQTFRPHSRVRRALSNSTNFPNANFSPNTNFISTNTNETNRAAREAPPPFSTAYQVSLPATVIDIDGPPPSYEDYLKIDKSKRSGSEKGELGPRQDVQQYI